MMFVDTQTPNARDEEIFSVLSATLPLIHETLVSHYRFIEEEAEAFEDTLCVWFHRVARRSGMSGLKVDELRQQLVFVAFKYARAFQIAKFRGVEPIQEEFTLALATPPEELVVQVLMRPTVKVQQ